MKIVILGAGALGTVLGAHLARAGEDVTLIARGQRAAYLQEHGATITGLVDFTVPVRVVTDPSQVHDADVLIVTVKTYDMASALAKRQTSGRGQRLVDPEWCAEERAARPDVWMGEGPRCHGSVQCAKCCRQARSVSRSIRGCTWASCPKGPRHGSRPWVTSWIVSALWRR